MGKKKERAKLKEREAAIAAELEQRQQAKAAKKVAKRGKAIEELMLTVTSFDVKKKVRREALELLGQHEAAEIEAVEARLGWRAHLDDDGYPRQIPNEPDLGPVDHGLGVEAPKTKLSRIADEVIADESSSEEAKTAASVMKAATDEVDEDATDEQIKARLTAKRERRAELASDEYRASIDRSNQKAISDYNLEAMSLGLYDVLTGDDEREKMAERIKEPGPGSTTSKDWVTPGSRNDEATFPALDDQDPKSENVATLVIDIDTSKVDDALKPAKKKKAKDAEELAAIEEEAEPAPQVAEEIATETGREFAVGSSVTPTAEADPFARPSEAPRVDLEEGRNGYKIIQLGADGKPDPRKIRQMTRVTTYVGNIDDETTLKKWDKRMVAEGLALDATRGMADGDREDTPLIVQINDIVHRREVKIAKAMRADRKGKLGVGEVGALVIAAQKESRDALNAIVEQAAQIAGRNDKADIGTHLHDLSEINDKVGTDEVRRLHETDTEVALSKTGVPYPVTATDVAAIEAYDHQLRKLGAEIVEIEAVIVNDELGFAGRLDRIIKCKLPELVMARGTAWEYTRPADVRARRYVMDVKSGSLELGAGKIARQLTAYSISELYDMETGERTPHRAARDVALVFHLPQGEGTAHVYAVDLKEGARQLKLSGDVRRARNSGKKTIDLSVEVGQLVEVTS